MDFIRGLFSSAPGLERLNPVGLVLMLVGAVLALIVSGIAGREDPGKTMLMKVVGLIVACIGAMIAIF